MISKVISPSFLIGLIQPKDRKYKLKNTRREEHIEIRKDGVVYALRTSVIPVVIEQTENKCEL